MSSLIIKISQNGTSREYLFNKLGPILIGSDQRCDLWLDDPHLEPKLLEVKVSGGQIFIKEVGARAEIYLNSVILPFREDAPYREGEIITLLNTNYQFQIHRSHDLHEPPPFVEGDFKDQFSRLADRIKERELELKQIEASVAKKREKLEHIDGEWSHHHIEKNRITVEIESLKNEKNKLEHDIKKDQEENSHEQARINQLKDYLVRLEGEESSLKETIEEHHHVLNALKADAEEKNKEIEKRRIILANLHLDVTQTESRLEDLMVQLNGQERQSVEEKIKIEKILHSVDMALKDKANIQASLAEVMRSKNFADQEIKDLTAKIEKLRADHLDAQKSLHLVRSEIHKEELRFSKIQEDIQRKLDDEEQLKLMNEELRSELSRAQDLLSHKKSQLNQMDFDAQESVKKIAALNFEIERTTCRLGELSQEEKTQELKMLTYREEIHSMVKKVTENKNSLEREMDEQKRKLERELMSIRIDIDGRKLELSDLKTQKDAAHIQFDELNLKNRSLLKEKAILEEKIQEFDGKRNALQDEIGDLKKHLENLHVEKSRGERDLSTLNSKLKECEVLIQQRQEEAKLSIDNYKREERSKMVAEKEILLAQVESQKQKSLIEIDAEYRRKQDELQSLRREAQLEAENIITTARQTEIDLTKEASARLRNSTTEAQARESLAYERLKEAEAILQTSKLEARQILRKAEEDLLKDLSIRKQKIKDFLSMKQESGLAHIKTIHDQQIARMKKNEELAHEKIEHLKRKELKKVSKLREEELSKHHEIKTLAMAEVKVEKEKAWHALQEMKKRQEAELAETRKTVLEHLNQTKVRQKEAWEEELRKEKALFEKTKKDRLDNATAAVMNVVNSGVVQQGEDSDKIRDKIRRNLEMAIDGQNAEAMMKVDQVLDFNPLKRKKIGPVLKKYALHFGVPAAMAIVILSDAGSLRTSVVEFSKDFIKQRESASDKFVKSQQVAWKEKYTYNPPTTPGYKETFTDNILYTADFEKIMDNEQFQNEWILKVHDFMVRELELPEEVAINYISSEGTLLKEIAVARKDVNPQFLEQGITKLKEIEKNHIAWLEEKIPVPEKLAKFKAFRKEYYDKYYAEKFQSPQRDVATEKPVISN